MRYAQGVLFLLVSILELAGDRARPLSFFFILFFTISLDLTEYTSDFVS